MQTNERYRQDQQREATKLFDSDAEVSMIDTTFARKAGCRIETSQTHECKGIHESVYKPVRRANINGMLKGSLVQYIDVWAGYQVGEEAILSMAFMVPTGMRLDLADGTLCLPDTVHIILAGQRPPYRSPHKISMIRNSMSLYLLEDRWR